MAKGSSLQSADYRRAVRSGSAKVRNRSQPQFLEACYRSCGARATTDELFIVNGEAEVVDAKMSPIGCIYADRKTFLSSRETSMSCFDESLRDTGQQCFDGPAAEPNKVADRLLQVSAFVLRRGGRGEGL